MSYDPGHPWYYKLGGQVLAIADIQPVTVTHEDYNRCRKTYKTDEQMLNAFQERLANDIKRYTELKERGAAALSRYDILMQGEESALHTALSLKHNHISFCTGYIRFIQQRAEQTVQYSLF